MRNQPLNPIFHDGGASDDSLIDPPEHARFRSLSVMFVIAALVVLGRIAWVQAELQSRYLEALNATTVEYEIIPARDGRILGSTAEVFATDVDQYSIQMHYRWLQNPVNEAWLNRQIRNQLSRAERKDPVAVEQQRAYLENQRQKMWVRTARAAGLSADAFTAKQAAIQQRVERMAESVNQRRLDNSVDTTLGESQGPLLKIASAIRSALTTTPRRRIQERIVIREEEVFHEVVGNVPFRVAAEIREQPHLFPGVRVVAGNLRNYPLDTVASHIVGARLKADEEEMQNLPGKLPAGSWVPALGRSGVERSYDHQLRGVPGLRRIVRNRRMEVVESHVEREPVGGRDIVLTLNVPLQQHAEQLLGEALLDRPSELLNTIDDSSEQQSPQPIPVGGAIVVMDITTGRLIVAASAPSFRLSLFTGGSSAEWVAINADKRSPLLSRVTTMALPPGSIMKPVTAVAALEAGQLDPDAQFHCQGFLTQPDEHRCLVYRLYGRGHNDVTLSRALAQSCNVYFFAAARKTGFGALRQWSERFGLGRSTGIDLPGERTGNLPGSSVPGPETDRQFRRETLGLAIGQSSLTVTPLQMARTVAAIANDGWLVTPHVVSPDGTARTTAEIDDRPRDLSRRKVRGLTESTLPVIRGGLNQVVNSPFGTGYRTVRLDEVAIAGKTGTAETGAGRPDHAWFAGYLPTDQPKFAFVVVLQNGGSGSRAAGPIARELARKMFALGILH